MGKGDKDALLTKIDISIYRCLLEKKNLCQKKLAEETNLTETSISRRLKKICNFKFLKKEKSNDKNKNNISIKKEFIIKIKNMIKLFEN